MKWWNFKQLIWHNTKNVPKILTKKKNFTPSNGIKCSPGCSEPTQRQPTQNHTAHTSVRRVCVTQKIRRSVLDRESTEKIFNPHQPNLRHNAHIIVLIIPCAHNQRIVMLWNVENWKQKKGEYAEFSFSCSYMRAGVVVRIYRAFDVAQRWNGRYDKIDTNKYRAVR